MKSRTALIGLIGLFIVVLQIKAATAFDLQCPPAVEAQTGDTVTLRFSIKPGMNVSNYLSVEWLYSDADSKTSEEVLLVHRGHVQEEKRFKGKIVILPEESSSENFSLEVTVDHPGTYNYTVYIKGKENNCSISLPVRARDTKSNLKHGDGSSGPDEKDILSDSDPGTSWGTISVGIITIGGIIIAIIVYRKRILSCFSVTSFSPPPPPSPPPQEAELLLSESKHRHHAAGDPGCIAGPAGGMGANRRIRTSSERSRLSDPDAVE